MQTRKVFCTTTSEDGTIKKVEDDKCDGSKKYESMMNCTGEQETCAGEWFTGPWKDVSTIEAGFSQFLNNPNCWVVLQKNVF